MNTTRRSNFTPAILSARTSREVLASPLASQNRKRRVSYLLFEKMMRKIQDKIARLKSGYAGFASRPPSHNDKKMCGGRVVWKAAG
jgi:hypothetical protein